MPIKPYCFDLTEGEIDYFRQHAAEILRSGILILGEYTRRFEQSFADFIGAKHAIAVNSGTTALEILLRLKKVENKAVLVPTNTNFATVAAVIRSGAIVQYLDMDKRTFAPTMEMVEEAVVRDPRIGVIVWVHIGGVISPEFPEVIRYCRQKGLTVLEDAAHAHGSELHGIKAGNLADGAAFSFFPTKVITTCEGGMITTNSDEEDSLARSLRNQGKRDSDFGPVHHDLGNSSRMTEINALLGSIQLERLSQTLKNRQVTYDIITKELHRSGIQYVSTRHMDSASNYKLIVLLPERKSLEEIKRRLASDGVFSGGGVYDIPCHLQPVFKGICAGASYPGAERWCGNHICPPLTSCMTENEARYVGETVARHLI